MAVSSLGKKRFTIPVQVLCGRWHSTHLANRCQGESSDARRPGADGPRLPLWWLALVSLLSLLCVAAGPPVLSGSQPGAVRVHPKQIAAMTAARQSPTLSAPAALLADSGTQQVLLASEPDQPRPNASTTKIMTALLALERANLADQVVVQPTAMIEGTTMGLVPGEVVTVEDLLWGMLLNSGNDAAAALAEHVAGSQAEFVALMNARAAELGMTHTHFVNPHGMDAPGHQSSAADLWRLTEAAMAYPVFRTMVATPTHAAAGRQFWNSNLLLGAYPGADGVKTGTTDLAGECLVASVTNADHRAIAVILGSSDRYTDAETLFNHYDTYYRWAPAPQPVGYTARVRGPDGRSYRVVVDDPPDLFLPRWQWPEVQTRPVFPASSWEPGTPAGSVRWYLGDQLLAEAPARLSAL